MSDQGQFNESLDHVIVVLINFLNKAPEQIKTMEYPGQPGQTCMMVLCSLIAKTFELAELLDEDMRAASGVCLANAIFENIQGVGAQVIPGILQIYFKQFESDCPSDLEIMLLQGTMMALWYDCATTL